MPPAHVPPSGFSQCETEPSNWAGNASSSSDVLVASETYCYGIWVIHCLGLGKNVNIFFFLFALFSCAKWSLVFPCNWEFRSTPFEKLNFEFHKIGILAMCKQTYLSWCFTMIDLWRELYIELYFCGAEKIAVGLLNLSHQVCLKTSI